MDISEIKDLSDVQLRDKLKENGTKPGPIGKSRNLYEKKLFKLVNGYELGKKPESKSSIKAMSPARSIPAKTIPAEKPILAKNTSRAKSPARTTRAKSPGRTTGTPSTNVPAALTPASSTSRLLTASNSTTSNNFTSTPKNIPNKKNASVPSYLENHQKLIKNSPKSPLTTHSIDFEKLTNQEIRALLRRNGSNCGPIPNASIRKLMVNKLKRIESEKGGLNRNSDGHIGNGDAPVKPVTDSYEGNHR